MSLAIHAIYDEVFNFSFDYGLEVVPDAGPMTSLDYYLYGRELPWDRMRLDASGVPREWERITGETYRPDYIACYALTNLGHYLRSGNEDHRAIFLKQIDWLEQHAVVRGDGAAVWTNNFDYREGYLALKAPWVSAHAQGYVISALVRGWRLTRREHILELLRRSLDIFDMDWDKGGVRVLVDGHVLYTEKPGLLPPGILDGFLRSLLGIYDLIVEFNDANAIRLFEEGIQGLEYMLEYWDYKKRWSWYGNHFYICSPAYHCINRLLLLVLARISGKSIFAECAEDWNPANLSAFGRAQIYLCYLFTKNACRWKFATWRHATQSGAQERFDAV